MNIIEVSLVSSVPITKNKLSKEKPNLTKKKIPNLPIIPVKTPKKTIKKKSSLKNRLPKKIDSKKNVRKKTWKARSVKDIRQNIKPRKQIHSIKKKVSHISDISQKEIKNRIKENLSSLTVSTNISVTTDLQTYFSRVQKLLYSRWQQPTLRSAFKINPKTTVRIMINKKGEILSTKIKRKSGNTQMETSIKKLLAGLLRLPSPPQNTSKESLNFTVTFELK
ncbi:MAG: energy transducer TonB [Verrucomicrobiota bacterium]|nr:energy transducer TonB [Verrucomicrobiota bacterium]